jgi:hypothetical protein
VTIVATSRSMRRPSILAFAWQATVLAGSPNMLHLSGIRYLDSTGSTVPRLVNFSGVLKDSTGKALTGTVALTLSLYAEQDGGSPLWVETQSVQPDDQGHYSLLLGATQPNGLPLDLFTSGTAQWLGVQPELPGAAEQPGVLLVGMPYALKAVDSDTLGGLPASAFLQAAAASQTSSASAGGTFSGTQVSGQDSTASPLALSGGTTDFIPLWTSSSTLGSSVLFQSGTGSTAKLGLNTTTPATLLDVNGAGTVRGTLSLPATGTATASAGKNSQPASLQASAFNSSTSAALNQTFNLQAEPTGNDTTSPSGKPTCCLLPAPTRQPRPVFPSPATARSPLPRGRPSQAREQARLAA